jgi:uncharacterized membrane protein
MIKVMPILAGMLAIAVVTTPLAVKAEPNYQGKRAAIELTQEQRTQMEQIYRNTRSKWKPSSRQSKNSDFKRL